jgi:transposase
MDLKIRPIHYHLEDRVRAHVFLCMLAYYVEWHMRRALAPILFDDDDPQAAEAAHQSIVSPAERSPKPKSKNALKRTEDACPSTAFKRCRKTWRR